MTHRAPAPAETRRWRIADGVEFRRCADDLLAFQAGSGHTHALGGVSVELCDAVARGHGPLDLDELRAAFSEGGAADIENALIPRETIEDALAELVAIGLVREVRP